MATDGREPDDLRLAPPDCPSSDDWQRRLAPPIVIPPPPQPASDWRFSITDLLVITGGAALGLAGGTWMPADLFAAILGLATLLGLLVVHLFPPRTGPLRLLWSALVCSYVTAVCTALLKSAMR